LHSRVHNLRRGITRRRQSQSRSAYDHVEEMVIAIIRFEEHVQTMCRQALDVASPERRRTCS
jgi:hypothetical protein